MIGALLCEPSLQLDHNSARFQLRHDLPAQCAQSFALFGGQFARNAINDAERSERMPVSADQRRAGVKANAWMGPDQRVAGETFVSGGVGNDKEILFHDGMRAEGDVSGSFGGA